MNISMTGAVTVAIGSLALLMMLDRAGGFRPPREAPAAVASPAAGPPAARGGPLAKGAIPRALPVDAKHQDTIDSLPAGKGQEETFYLCAACHGTALIKAQGMTRDMWDSTFQLMVEKHAMANPDPDDRALILDYLATNFPPRRRGRDNPFLK